MKVLIADLQLSARMVNITSEKGNTICIPIDEIKNSEFSNFYGLTAIREITIEQAIKLKSMATVIRENECGWETLKNIYSVTD